MTLTDKELLLLNSLRQNCRSNLSKLSKQIGLSVSTLFNKLKKLEKNHIQKHTIILDYKKIGYPIRNHFIVKPEKTIEFKNLIFNHFNVNSIFLVEKGEYYVDCLFQDFKEMDDFINLMEDNDIKVNQAIHIIEDIKVEEFSGYDVDTL